MIAYENGVAYTTDVDFANFFRIEDKRSVYHPNEQTRERLNQQTKWINFYVKKDKLYYLPAKAYQLPPLTFINENYYDHGDKKLYERQHKLIEDSVRGMTTKGVLIHSGTATGKTVIIRSIFKALGNNGVFVTARTSVREELEDRIPGGEYLTNEMFKRKFDEYNDGRHLFLDEAHNLSEAFRQHLIFWKGRIFGFTATPFRTDFDMDVMGFKMVFGNYVATNQTALPVNLYYKKYQSRRSVEDAYNITSEYAEDSPHRDQNLLIFNDGRNDILVDIAQRLFKKYQRIILFTARHQHKDLLYSRLLNDSDLSQFVFLLDRKMKKSQRDEIEKTDKYILIANYQYAKEGVNMPSLNACLICFPTKNIQILDQMVGRVRRFDEANDKKSAIVVDLFDSIKVGEAKTKYKSYNQRKKIYLSLGYNLYEIKEE